MLKAPKWIREKVLTKWGIVTIAFVVYILFLNEHNVLQHLQNKSKLHQLTEQSYNFV